MPTTQDASTDQQHQFHPEIVKKSTTRLLMYVFHNIAQQFSNPQTLPSLFDRQV
jgi:hypothetical protein